MDMDVFTVGLAVVKLELRVSSASLLNQHRRVGLQFLRVEDSISPDAATELNNTW